MERKKALILFSLVAVAAILGNMVLAPASVAAQYGYVHGIAVDEEGIGLSEVGVQIYTSGGALVAATSTGSDGSFGIWWVEFGTYNIYLTKPGYAKAVKSIAVEAQDIDLGTIVLGRALRLSSSTLSLIASPGDKISVPFTVSNTGEDAEVVELVVVSKPQDWTVRVLEEDHEVTKAYISSGQSLTLQLEVTVPLTAFINVSYSVSLNAIGTTNPSLTFTILVRPQPTASVSGRTVDEYGNGMEGVEIEVYSSDGAFIKSASTSSDGSFTVELPISTAVSAYFSREGYVKVTKSVVSEGEKVEIGEIVLLKAVRLYCSVSGLVAIPGDRLLLPFVVSNIGEEQEKVEFLISNPEGWQTRVLDEASREIKKAELSSSASLNLQLEVTIPPTSTGDNNLTLTTVGKTNSTLDFMIKVQPLSESILSCQFPGKSATLGDTVQFQVRLTNPLGVKTRFKISVDSISPNWTASVKSSSGEYLTEVILGSNEFVDLVVEVESPDAAKVGEEYGLLFKVISYDGTIVDSLPLNISLNEVEEKIKIVVKFPEVTVEAGKVIQYPVTITNPGGVDRPLFLSVEPPADWKVVFKSETLEVSRLYLEAGGSESLVIEATPPSTVNIGTYSIPVQVKSENGAIYTEMRLKATIIGSYALSLEPSTLLTSVITGGSTTFTAKITNTGSTPATGVRVGVEAPEGWESSLTPVQVESLEPKGSFTFTLVVTTPGDTVAGDYLVTLTGLSDQVESDSVQVRFTATTPTSWGLIGLGIAVVMVVALLLVFIKFRRR